MQQHRYDNTGATYGPPISLPPGGTYNMSNIYEHQENVRYYDHIHPGMNTAEAQRDDRYHNTLPAAQPINRYQPEHPSSTRTYPPQGPPGSPSVPYGPSPYSYNSSVDHPSHPTQFIPTPSEMANYPPIGGSQTPGHPPERYPAGHDYGGRNSISRLSRIAATPGSRAVPGGSPTAGSGERFLCERCGKTFSRSHDRKRHHETQHLPTPVIHRCRYCEKEFSRSDSLKRHVDNGCDEMP